MVFVLKLLPGLVLPMMILLMTSQLSWIVSEAVDKLSPVLGEGCLGSGSS